MRAYAEGTSVSVEKTKAELDSLLGKHGATARGVLSDDQEGKAYVHFVLGGERFQLVVPLPKLQEFPNKGEQPRDWYAWTDAKRGEWRYRTWEQACRERWRAVLLLVKSKLEIVRLGMSSVRHEFMADLVLANGKTVAEMMASDDGQRLLPPAEVRQ